jgi:hypothetical protein
MDLRLPMKELIYSAQRQPSIARNALLSFGMVLCTSLRKPYRIGTTQNRAWIDAAEFANLALACLEQMRSNQLGFVFPFCILFSFLFIFLSLLLPGGTSQYTWWNFLPKNLFEQVAPWLKPANFFFLCIAVLQVFCVFCSSGYVSCMLFFSEYPRNFNDSGKAQYFASALFRFVRHWRQGRI